MYDVDGYCELCLNPESCSLCGRLETYHDLFGEHWCEIMAFSSSNSVRDLKTGRIVNMCEFRGKTCYLAGPMGGMWRKNQTQFEIAAARIRHHRIKVISPFEIDLVKGYLKEMPNGDLAETELFDYETVLAHDFEQIEASQLVILLDDWQWSPGATREVQFARDIGVPCYEIR